MKAKNQKVGKKELQRMKRQQEERRKKNAQLRNASEWIHIRCLLLVVANILYDMN